MCGVALRAVVCSGVPQRALHGVAMWPRRKQLWKQRNSRESTDESIGAESKGECWSKVQR
jgi:hypothetical protein